jgi:glutamine cyclotransferase
MASYKGSNTMRSFWLILLGVGLALTACNKGAEPLLQEVIPPTPPTDSPPVYTYQVINTFPHDPTAFTQGLVFFDGVVYEGTGLNGQSSLRKVNLESGEVIQQHNLEERFFGEGIVVFEERIIQLTWRSQLAFVYARESFELLSRFNYPTEGWGLTHDGKRLIISDGTATLYFRDPETFAETGRLEVRDGTVPVTRLNELEYIEGQIFANVWQTDRIARIAPDSGQVLGWVDLAGLLSPSERRNADVLNGIAYDPEQGRIFVTGKWWPHLFEIELVRR